MSTFRWLTLRLGAGLATVLVVSILIFLATQALPGDIARVILGRDATPDQVAALSEALGLNRPIWAQYLSWLGSVLAGDMGMSLVARIPVLDLVTPRIVNSFTLVLISIALTIPLALVLGVLAAARRDSLLDKALMGASNALNALPAFVVGMLLVMVFSTNVFRLLPSVSVLTPGVSPLAQLDMLVLPIVTLTLLNVSYLYRLLRASVLDVLDSEYIQLARLKGLSQRRVLFRHALPNALLPGIQATANIFAFSVGSIVVIEYLFAFPGIGTGLTDAVANRDIPVVQFIVLFVSAVFVGSNLVADLLTSALVPPSRRAQS